MRVVVEPVMVLGVEGHVSGDPVPGAGEEVVVDEDVVEVEDELVVVVVAG